MTLQFAEYGVGKEHVKNACKIIMDEPEGKRAL
jgi:hypothetical protein